jgi:hypothetical protein
VTEKTKAGRPSFTPTDRDRGQVKTMGAMGIPDYDIAKVIGVSVPTLRKYFRSELDTGHIEANAKVAQSLFKQATGEKPNVTAAIFWLKARAGWRDGSRPMHEEDETPGKKAQAQQAARTAAAGTEWDGLLPESSTVQ